MLTDIGTPSGCRLSLEELAMPDLDQIKQGEQGVRDRRGRFARGRSANPAGRRVGCRDRRCNSLLTNDQSPVGWVCLLHNSADLLHMADNQ
jgi:hypothetical protein